MIRRADSSPSSFGLFVLAPMRSAPAPVKALSAAATPPPGGSLYSGFPVAVRGGAGAVVRGGIEMQDLEAALEGFSAESLRGAGLFESGVEWGDVGGLNGVRAELREMLEVSRFSEARRSMSSRANSGDHEARRTPGGRSLILLCTGGLRSSTTGFSHNLEIAHRISRPNPRSPREIAFEGVCFIVASAALDVGIATLGI